MKKIMLTAALCGFMFAASAQSETKQDNSLAKVEQIHGLYVFIKSTPIAEYEHLGVIKGPKIGNHEMDRLTETFIKRVTEQYPNADAILFDGQIKQTHNTKVSAIKFK